MKTLNQKGFTLVEGLLAVLVLAVVGFGGYYVYSQNSDDSQMAENSESTDEEATENADSEETEVSRVEIPTLGVAVNDPENRGLEYKQDTMADPTGYTDDVATVHYITSSDNPNFEECGYPLSVTMMMSSEVLEQTEYHVELDGNQIAYIGFGTNYQAPCAPDGVEDEEYRAYTIDLREYVVLNTVNL